MNEKVSYRFETPRYPYARVEGALAAVFNLDADRQGPLRGRLKHLNQLGLPGLKAGKGARVRYSSEHVSQWLVALLMAELGIDPTVIVRLIKSHWKQIRHWVQQATDNESKAGNHIFLTLRPRLMSAAWAKDKHPLDTVPWVGGFRRYDYKRRDAKGRSIQRENVAMFLDRCSEEGWLCTRDLTDDVERLQGYLDAGEKK
jgi:hypothetical protein